MQAAVRLNQLRETWLNPPELVRREPEVVAGFPDRLIPVDEKALAELKKRTLTNLYNARPAWLAQAHDALDSAVAAAYEWPPDIGDDEALGKLLKMNRDRAAAQGLE
jgi:type II restriction/modification system DNA methylase subunit YeeA